MRSSWRGARPSSGSSSRTYPGSFGNWPLIHRCVLCPMCRLTAPRGAGVIGAQIHMKVSPMFLFLLIGAKFRGCVVQVPFDCHFDNMNKNNSERAACTMHPLAPISTSWNTLPLRCCTSVQSVRPLNILECLGFRTQPKILRRLIRQRHPRIC